MRCWLTVALLALFVAGGCSSRKDTGKAEDEKRELAKQAYNSFSEVEDLCEAGYMVAGDTAGKDNESLTKARQKGAALYAGNAVFAELVDEIHQSAEGAATPAGGTIDYCESKFQVPLHNRLMKFR